MTALLPYEPLNVLKPVAPDIWIVDGEIVRMRYLGLRLPFTTRMTVVRLPSGTLWIHSPTTLTDGLAEAVKVLGPVRYLVAPNRLHYVFLPAWQDAWPDAQCFAAPGMEGLAARHGFRIDRTLGATAPDGWSETLDQVLVPGQFLTEAVFFHRPSRTLIVTDLIQCSEPAHVVSRWLRFLTDRVGGMMYPNVTTPRDLRLTFLGHMQAVRHAIETMIGWNPDRIVISHGRCFERDGAAVLQRAFAWAHPAVP